MAIVDVGHIGEYSTSWFAAQVGWPGLRVGSRLALTFIRQMNQMNSSNDLCHDDSTINIVPGIIIIIIIIFKWYVLLIIIIIIIIIIF